VHGHLLLTAAIAGVSQALVAAQQPEARFTARSELVVLHASVTDGRGSFVSGLTADAFRVLEEGRPQGITFFAQQDAPVTVGLLIDASGSMMENRDRVIAAITSFVASSHPDDEFLPLVFNERVTRVLPATTRFTNDPSELRNALTAHLGARGRTAFHDALVESLGGMQHGRHERKVLVVLSDGGDNHSRLTFDQALEQVLASNVVIYTMALVDPLARDSNPRALRRLAELTGGLAVEPRNATMVGKALQSIAADIRSCYTLAYAPANAPAGGRVRRVQVAVEVPGRSGLRVRTRTGYIAEASEPDEGKREGRK
jgi:VWFA-related protein